MKQLIFEIKAVVEDCRNKRPGSFCTALMIWEMAVIPYLYHAAECWIDAPKQSIQVLMQLQVTFYKAILATGNGCPTVGLFWQTGGMLPEYRIMEYKLLFYHHIRNLDKQTLAFRISQEERKMKIRGFMTECKIMLAELKVKESDVEVYSKFQWKKMIRELVVARNREELLERAKGYKKNRLSSNERRKIRTKTIL